MVRVFRKFAYSFQCCTSIDGTFSLRDFQHLEYSSQLLGTSNLNMPSGTECWGHIVSAAVKSCQREASSKTVHRMQHRHMQLLTHGGSPRLSHAGNCLKTRARIHTADSFRRQTFTTSSGNSQVSPNRSSRPLLLSALVLTAVLSAFGCSYYIQYVNSLSNLKVTCSHFP